MPLQFAGAIAGAHQDGLGAHATGKFHIAVAIADHEGAAQIESVFPRGALQQTRFGLSAVAGVLTLVWAIVHRIEACAGGGKFLCHPIVHGLNQGFGKVSASNTRLIGDDDDWQVALIEGTNGRSRKWKDAKAAEMVEVADFIGDGAVAIEEDSGAEGTGLRQRTPRR